MGARAAGMARQTGAGDFNGEALQRSLPLPFFRALFFPCFATSLSALHTSHPPGITFQRRLLKRDDELFARGAQALADENYHLHEDFRAERGALFDDAQEMLSR